MIYCTFCGQKYLDVPHLCNRERPDPRDQRIADLERALGEVIELFNPERLTRTSHRQAMEIVERNRKLLEGKS